MTDAIGTTALGVVIGLVTSYFFNRWNRDYVTTVHCQSCRREKQDADSEFKREVREKLGIMTGALVILAAGKEISLEEVQKLLTAGLQK